MRRGLFPHTVTIWVTTPDAAGGYSYASPVSVRARYEQRQEIFRDENGDQVLSRAIVYLEDTDVKVNDYIVLGTSVASTPVAVTGVYQVRAFMKSPAINGNEYLRKAVL